MIEISQMQEQLEQLITSSKLDKIFKPGKVKIQDKKLPHWVSIRLKLHNPFSFTEFVIIEKKSGLKFAIHHTKDINFDLHKFLLSNGGSPDNSNTIYDFDFEKAAEIATSLYNFLVLPSTISKCEAQDYKPIQIILSETEKK